MIRIVSKTNRKVPADFLLLREQRNKIYTHYLQLKVCGGFLSFSKKLIEGCVHLNK